MNVPKWLYKFKCRLCESYAAIGVALKTEVSLSTMCSVLESQGSKPDAPDDLDTLNDQPLHITINHNCNNNTIEVRCCNLPLHHADACCSRVSHSQYLTP